MIGAKVDLVEKSAETEYRGKYYRRGHKYKYMKGEIGEYICDIVVAMTNAMKFVENMS